MDYKKLVKDCLNGVPTAYRDLYDQFAESMLGVCYRYTKSVKDAEDVLQEGFIKVFKYLHQFKFQGELGAWIRKIMVTTALNYLKQNRKYKYEVEFSSLLTHPVCDDNPIINLQTKELAELIRQLPVGAQTVFNLYAVEGYTHIEIGKLLGISNSTSKSQYARAKTLLVQWIEKLSIEPKTGCYAGK